ncbi:MAG: saccharopine dehydrogenase C-terminal domain-containing protein [Actinomycetota bacterium]|nr:saccharopine dehydrogenase C-terminal domain-containing protein [Actinomycetota bacterium]
MAPNTLVLGAGIVGSAAVWDLVRRGHTVTVADADAVVADSVATAFGASSSHLDVSDEEQLADLLDGFDAVISAVPYRFGVEVAAAAIRAGAHYADFGGNPTVVSRQQELNDAAIEADVLVAPDCGLAPGLANAMAEHLITTTPGRVRSVQIRVGALPPEPIGTLGYQLAFSPAGLINEYAEPCEIVEDGSYRTVEPLTRFETVEWKGRGPLEAFSTAGGTSTMCRDHQGRVDRLEYKTLRFPGHGRIFAAIRDMGLFDETGEPSPRSVLLAALARTLPRGDDDLVLVRVWVETDETTRTMEIEDVHDGRFSALARTTAFPATALIDLVTRGDIEKRGVRTMQHAIDGGALIASLQPVGITVTDRRS